MWTYLAILFSVLLFFAVFLRRLVLFLKKGGAGEVDVAPENGKKTKERSGKRAVEKAVKEAEKSVKEDVVKLSRGEKQRVKALCGKGEDLAKRGKEEKAIKMFVQALAIDEHHMETQHKLAVLYLKKQMYSAAAALFKKLSEADEDASHFSHLGLALYHQGVFPEAKDAYHKAVVLDPSRPARFISLAQVYRKMGQNANASVAVIKAVELDAENLDFLFLLADLYVELEDLADAKEVLERILELDEGNKEAEEMLGKLGKG